MNGGSGSRLPERTQTQTQSRSIRITWAFPECCPGVGRACSEEALEAAKPRQKDWRMPYCSQDEQLFSLIGMQEIHDHSQGQWEGAYRNHRHENWADVKREFAAKYYNWLDSHVDLFLCGHPLFWCTLFEDLLRANQKKSMLAVYDQPPFFLVPEEGEDDFVANLRAFADPEFRNAVLVGFAPFFSPPIRMASRSQDSPQPPNCLGRARCLAAASARLCSLLHLDRL